MEILRACLVTFSENVFENIFREWKWKNEFAFSRFENASGRLIGKYIQKIKTVKTCLVVQFENNICAIFQVYFTNVYLKNKFVKVTAIFSLATIRTYTDNKLMPRGLLDAFNLCRRLRISLKECSYLLSIYHTSVYDRYGLYVS